MLNIFIFQCEVIACCFFNQIAAGQNLLHKHLLLMLPLCADIFVRAGGILEKGFSEPSSHNKTALQGAYIVNFGENILCSVVTSRCSLKWLGY